MNHQNKVACWMAVVIYMLLLSCSNKEIKNNRAKHESMSFTDMSGRIVKIPKTIHHIVSNGSPGLIIVYTLADTRLIARNFAASEAEKRFCTQHFCELPSIGSWFLSSGSRNTETLLNLKPDVIISCGNINSMAAQWAEKDQQYLGMPILQFSSDFSKLSDTYKLLGELLNEEVKAAERISFIKKYLLPVIEHGKAISDSIKPRIYMAIGNNGLTTSPRGSIHAQVIEYAGAINVVDVGKEIGHVDVNVEQVLNWNPEIILTCGRNNLSSKHIKDFLLSNDKWSGVSAVNTKKIVAVPMEPYCWIDLPPSINQIIGVIWLSYLMYPEWFPFDFDQVVSEFYSLFYHYNLSPLELENICQFEL